MTGRAAVVLAVSALLDGLVLDDAGKARAAIALALARKLDESVRSEAAAVAVATASIAKELRSVLDALTNTGDDANELLERLFAPVGDGKV